MSLESISRLAELTGTSTRTVKRRLETLTPIQDGKALKYESREALALIYQLGSGEEDAPDLSLERAKLARAQRIKIDLETEVLRGNLIPADTVERVWSDLLGAFRARCLAVPSRAALQVLAVADLNEAETILKGLIHEALNELHDYDPTAYQRAGAQGRSDGSAAPDPDDLAMGGRGAAPKSRVQRRARKVEH